MLAAVQAWYGSSLAAVRSAAVLGFRSVDVVGQTSHPWSMPYERGLDVSSARRRRVSLRQAWPRLKRFI